MALVRRRAMWLAIAALVAVAVTFFAWQAWDQGRAGRAGPLPALGADLARTSVSGLSSGAYMAGQVQIAHSDIIIGAGLVAGGPYGCAESDFSRLWPIWTTAVPHNLNLALNACMDDSLAMVGQPDIDTLARRTRELADEDKIAPVSGLSDDRVYLFHARQDDTVVRSVVEAAADYYRAMGVPRGRIRFERFERGAHAFITEDDGPACGTSGPPFLNDCDYDQAGAILRHVLGELQQPDGARARPFTAFDQYLYTPDGEAHSVAAEGAVYVPATCRDTAGCAIHVVFHGCEQNRAQVGDAFIRGSGFARWADANRLIVLFPQTKRSTVNPKACWDWWGYTGLDYRTRTAPQIAAIRAMLERLAQRR